MNFLLLIGILLCCWSDGITAQNCRVENGHKCTFHGVTLRKNQVLYNVAPNPWITEIVFRGSNLYSIPIELFRLFGVEKLRLRYAKVKEIKENSFVNAYRLKYLDLEGNELTTLKANSFVGCSNLEELHGYSPNIELGAFNGLPKLKKFSFIFSGLTSIHENLFDPLTNLEKIWLRDNHLDFLSENTFRFNLKLKFIDLRGNRLTSLSSKTFSLLSNLNELLLVRNKCVNRDWHSNAIHHMENIKATLQNCNANYLIKGLEEKIRELEMDHRQTAETIEKMLYN